MNCSKAHEYFMKHVDNCLNGMESEWLDKHLMKCERCREDFVSYEAILGAILVENEEAVPSDLEAMIMDQIGELSLAKKEEPVSTRTNTLHIILGISLALTMIALPIAAAHWARIIELQAALNLTLEPVRHVADELGLYLYSVSGALDMLFERLRFVMIFAIVALVFIQLMLWKKDKAAA